MPRTFLDDLGFRCFTQLGLGVLICKMRGLKLDDIEVPFWL